MRKDIRYLSYSMILMHFFKKAKLRVKEEMQLLMPIDTTIITISNLHKMHLTLGDDGRWVRAHTTSLTPSMPPTTGEGSTTQAIVGAPNMTIAQSHALLIEEMHKLYVHLMDKLSAQSEHIKTISTNLLKI